MSETGAGKRRWRRWSRFGSVLGGCFLGALGGGQRHPSGLGEGDVLVQPSGPAGARGVSPAPAVLRAGEKQSTTAECPCRGSRAARGWSCPGKPGCVQGARVSLSAAVAGSQQGEGEGEGVAPTQQHASLPSGLWKRRARRQLEGEAAELHRPCASRSN